MKKLNTNPLKKIVTLQKAGQPIGIYSACSANPYVIKACLLRGKQDHSCVLIESTANQCNQNGGYTGMTPFDFKKFVLEIAKEVEFDPKNLFLGGDHLGPLTWRHMNEKDAMHNSAILIDQYVSAGFTKIHIDTSMHLKDDNQNEKLTDETIARRGAVLAKVAQEAYDKLLSYNPGAVPPVYIIGSEVPTPGGATNTTNDALEITTVEDFKNTLATFESTFLKTGISDAWKQVIAIVVQPGIEERDEGCIDYDRSKAFELTQAIKEYPNIVFEGHSTDYQTQDSLKALVEDGVAILKVGPALTFAFREALFALANIEKELLQHTTIPASQFIETLEKAMLENPSYWQSHYQGTENDLYIKRKYSFSDRCRYYFPLKEVSNAKDTLIKNTTNINIPLQLLSQFMPIQYNRIRQRKLNNDAESLLLDYIIQTIDSYLYATNQKELGL